MEKRRNRAKNQRPLRLYHNNFLRKIQSFRKKLKKIRPLEVGDEWPPGAQRSEATGPNRGEIRSLRCAPFPAAIIIGEFVSDLHPGRRPLKFRLPFRFLKGRIIECFFPTPMRSKPRR